MNETSSARTFLRTLVPASSNVAVRTDSAHTFSMESPPTRICSVKYDSDSVRAAGIDVGVHSRKRPDCRLSIVIAALLL